jgi:GMP synthase (glutamine-hydrolysing)
VSPRVTVVQHEDDCPPAHLGTWLAEAGADLTVCRPYAGEVLPDRSSYDALVVLGGSMGAHDDADHPWLTPVKQRIRDAADDHVPVLGVCLGHQLAAAAFGGASGRNPRGQQFGLFAVGWTPDAHLDALMAPVATPRRGVQWNDDIVTELPAGTVVLARAATGEVQAARFAPTVWGVQLHPEVDEPILRPWALHDRDAHVARGLDPDAVLAEIDGARAELDAAWRPLAARFVEITAHAQHRVP